MFALRVHSHFSLMHGTASPLALCEQAKHLGYTHLALTDKNNLYGLPAFIAACKQTGINPIIGAELSVNHGGNDAEETSITCLVESSEGYANLCTLISKCKCDKDFLLENIEKEMSNGLIILCSSLQHLEQFTAKEIKVAADLGCRPNNESRELRRWAKEKKIPAVATLNSSILIADDELHYNLLRAIGQNSTLSHVALEKTPEPLLSPEELTKRFAIWPEVIATTIQVGASCTFRGPDFGIVMPPWQDVDKRYPSEVLREQAYKGAQIRYGEDLNEAVVDRLEYELKVIDDMGFSSYFLIVRDIIHPADEHGVRHKRRICGRGSGAASLVAYCLEITNVCPVRHNLYFERFLNPGRQDPPDIDIDFAWDEREQVLEEVLEKYKGYVAMVSNHVYFQPKMAIRETAKAFGMPTSEISTIAKKLHWISSASGESLESKINKTPSCRETELNHPWPEILRLADKIVGIPRYLSVHPGGVIITPDQIDRYVPVEISTKSVPIIQWEKDGAEDSGLIKIDILGNRSLGVIRDAIINLKNNGHALSEREWLPEEDKPTQEAVAKGKTMGCFYIESPAMRLLQKKAATGDFEQLVLQSSIIRPAANDFVREYVRRLHGGKWELLHPALGEVLGDTFGLMVYQEDVSKVAVTLAGFSHARADGLRKVLSKKDRELRLKDYKEEFYIGCQSKDISVGTIDQLWSMILSFDGYSFCKPHSASYAKVSYQAAYLKKHYPAEFMAAVISNQGGFYSTFAYVSEAKRMGITILPPDVNKSRFHWQGEGTNLRIGFLSVKGLSLGTIKRLHAQQDKKSFSDTADFLHRVSPSDDEGRALIHVGALDSLQKNVNRETALWELASFKQLTQQKKMSSLFPPSLPKAPVLKPQTTRNRLRYEYKYLGFLCSCHPITLLSLERTENSRIKAKDIKKYIGKNITIAGWLLTGKIVSTKTGEAMEFLTFEDETSAFETTFFPRVYRKYAHILEAEKGYILHGLVDEDFGAVTVTVGSVLVAR